MPPLNSKALHTRGILLLVLITLIWGTSFPLAKSVVSQLEPATLIAVRFVLAAVAFAPWLRKLNARLIRDGVLLGLIYFAECASSLIGLQTISANRAAFIISLNVILVPLLGLLLGRRLPIQVLLASGLAFAGIGVMAWEGGGLSHGDLWQLGCALGIAVYILVLESATRRHPPRPLAAIQILVMALLGTIWAMPQLVGQIDQVEQIGQNFSALLYLGLVVTTASVGLQAMAQRWVSAPEAALVYTLEPVFAAIFSFWLLGEELGRRELLGAGFVLCAMLLSQSRWVSQSAPAENPKRWL